MEENRGLGVGRRPKFQLFAAAAASFLLVVSIGVASAGEAPTSRALVSPETPREIELAPAVVVAAGADSINTNAVARISSLHDDKVEFGTGFQLDDGRVATVSHAIVDARSVRFGGFDEALDIADPNTSPEVAITRLHDVASISGAPLSSSLSVADEPGIVGQSVALAGVPEDGRVTALAGEIIARTAGVNYGLGRPDVYAISATVGEGFSGGPVVNADGDVIAVIVGSELRSGVTLAVPIEHLPPLG